MAFLLEHCYQKRTSEHDEKHRFDYWRDIICDEFVQLDCEKVSGGAFDGEVRGGVCASYVNFSEVISDPQIVRRSKKQIAKSGEADFLISFQISKNGLVKQSGREALLTPGNFALYDSTQPYTLTFNERFHQLVVQMPKEVLSRYLLDPERYTAIPISGTSGLGAILTTFIFSLVRELHELQHAPEELSENLVNMIAMAFSSSVMLEHVGESTVVREALKRRIVQYINNNFCNPELSNSQIAHAQGISLRYLHKLFENEDETIHSLIHKKRLNKGYALLEDPAFTGYSIEHISYSLGFSSAAHFSKSFRKQYGVSPSTIR